MTDTPNRGKIRSPFKRTRICAVFKGNCTEKCPVKYVRHGIFQAWRWCDNIMPCRKGAWNMHNDNANRMLGDHVCRRQMAWKWLYVLIYRIYIKIDCSTVWCDLDVPTIRTDWSVVMPGVGVGGGEWGTIVMTAYVRSTWRHFRSGQSTYDFDGLSISFTGGSILFESICEFVFPSVYMSGPLECSCYFYGQQFFVRASVCPNSSSDSSIKLINLKHSPVAQYLIWSDTFKCLL